MRQGELTPGPIDRLGDQMFIGAGRCEPGWSVHVTGSGGQSGEVDPVGLYGRDVGMNEVMTLDRLRQVGSRGATRAGLWFE